MNENKDLLLKMLSDEPVLYEIIKSKRIFKRFKNTRKR
jgi:hypothetical protein